MSLHQSNNAYHNNRWEYWEQLFLVIDSRKERLWDGLIEGFEMYNKVLNERALLIQDTDSLRQQVFKLSVIRIYIVILLQSYL